MSYILDALRRAERERNAAQPPPLAIVTQGGAPQIVARGIPRLWLIAGLVAGVVLVVTLLVVLLRDDDAPAPPATEVALADPGEQLELPDDAALIPADEVDPAGPALARDAPVQTLDDLWDAEPALEDEAAMAELMDEPMDEPLDEPLDEPTANPIEDFEPEDAGAPASAKPPPPPDKTFDTADPVLDPPQPASASPAAPVTASETLKFDPPPTAGPKRYKEMPASYRADFPQLAIDVHVYDKKREARWIIVNTRRYREGDTLSEGPRVAEIVREGIVFDFRGERVLYPLGH